MEKLLMKIEEMSIKILSKYDELDLELNKGELASVETLDSIQAEIKALNELQNAQYAELRALEYASSDVIVEKLSAQGFKVECDGEGNYTVYGDDYDVSISVMDKGYYVETWCHLVGIEHFRVQEWTNCKTVKTLKGLNGYLRKYIGADAITL